MAAADTAVVVCAGTITLEMLLVNSTLPWLIGKGCDVSLDPVKD